MKQHWTDTPSPVASKPHAMSKESIGKEIGKELRGIAAGIREIAAELKEIRAAIYHKTG